MQNLKNWLKKKLTEEVGPLRIKTIRENRSRKENSSVILGNIEKSSLSHLESLRDTGYLDMTGPKPRAS